MLAAQVTSDQEPGPSSTSTIPNRTPSPPTPASPTYNVDDIKVEHHEASGLGVHVYPFEEFNPRASDINPDPSDKPWVPFTSRADFEFAELAHEAHLNKGQVTRLLTLIKKISSRQDTFTFHTTDDVDTAWEKAKLQYPSVCSKAFSM